MDGVSIYPVTTKIQACFLTQLSERKETAQGFHHEANGDFKTVTELNGCERRKLRLDQQHCSFSDEIRATLVHHVLIHGRTMREAGQLGMVLWLRSS